MLDCPNTLDPAYVALNAFLLVEGVVVRILMPVEGVVASTELMLLSANLDAIL
jgi:hypothetical protein